MKKTGHGPRVSTSRSNSSCAACKLLKRRCGPSCILAPYFRADEPKKFAQVHKVFGASNVSKILSEVPVEHRQDTVNSLSYEAEARLRDPVYGCLGPIALLHRRMVELQHDLTLARARLARCAVVEAPNASACGSTSYGHWYCEYDRRNVAGYNLDHDHDRIQQLPLVQFEGPQFGPNEDHTHAATTDFGQVPLLPL